MNWFLILVVALSLNCEVMAITKLQKDEEWISSIFTGYQKEGTKYGRQSGCSECQCGMARPSQRMSKGQARVVDGVEVKKHKYPWMVAIMQNEVDILCGGALINDQYVLTAAHCDIIPKEKMRVRAYVDSLINDTDHKVLNVSEIIKHENYSPFTNDNDIALYKLTEKVIFDDKISPICLPPADELFVGMNAIVIGWGRIRSDGPTSDYLREAQFPVVSEESCKKTYRNIITKNMICAGDKDSFKDACVNDSGGPLMIVEEGTSKYKTIGAVSFGISCGIPGVPGVYARVNNYLDWIGDNTEDACYCT